MRPIYLDYAATTPVEPEVAEVMAECLTMDGVFANPASRSHVYGWRAEELVEAARAQVAEMVKLDSRAVVWTSGATEANNLALKGVFERRNFQGQFICGQVEHKAVLDVAQWLANKGVQVRYLPVDQGGRYQLDLLAEWLKEPTALVSLMWINNETGVVQDIERALTLCHHQAVPLHVDAAQAVGKLDIDLAHLPIDLVSLSAHKFYGPKGVGCLLVHPKALVQPLAQLHGGGHERGMRSGTLPTHQLVGMGLAAALVDPVYEAEHLAAMRDQLWQGLQQLPVQINGDLQYLAPSHLNLAFAGLDGETLLLALNQIAVSTGSACNSLSLKPSYVLKAMGLSDALAQSSLRLSVGRYTQASDIKKAIFHIQQVVTGLLQQNPTGVMR